MCRCGTKDGEHLNVGLGQGVELVVAVEGDEEVPGGRVGAGVGQPQDQPEHRPQAQHLRRYI